MITCPKCQARYRTKPEWAGKKLRCQKCQHILTIPEDIAKTESSEASGDAVFAGRKGTPEQPTHRAPEAPEVQPSTQDLPNESPRMDSSQLYEIAERVKKGLEPSEERPTQEISESHSDPDTPNDPPKKAHDLSFLHPPEEPDELGRLGDFRILKVLGKGGMGMVLLGEDTKLHRAVAIKVMLPDLGASETARERFLREARSAAAVEHSRVVPIYQVGEDGDIPYVVMPLLQGETLDARLRREGILSIAEILRLGKETAEGLAAAHNKDLIHRDIKPANIWIEKKDAPEAGESWLGNVKILDFGLARATSGEEIDLTGKNVVLGTAAYMSPQQATAQELDPRTDLFSLGCVLYRMSTRQLPFQGGNSFAVRMSIVADPPKRVESLNPKVPVGLADLIHELLEKNPSDRPASAEEVIERLAKLQEEDARTEATPPVAGVKKVPVPTAKKPKGSGLWIGGALALVMLVVLGIVGAVYGPSLFLTPTDPTPPLPPGPPPTKSKGVLLIQSVDPKLKFAIRKNGKTIIASATPRKFELEPGEYTLELTEKADLFEVTPANFTIKEKNKITISVIPLPPNPFAHLKRSDIDPYELQMAIDHNTGKTPKELVAVLGDSRWQGWSGSVQSIAFSPDGERVATVPGHDGRHTRVWDRKTGKQMFALPGGHREAVFSADGKILFTGYGGGIGLWNGETGKLIKTLQAPGYPYFSVSPDNKHVASVRDNLVEIWDVDKNTKLQTLEGHTKRITRLAYSPDGKWLASASEDQTVILWDAQDGTQVHTFKHKDRLLDIAFSPDSKLLASLSTTGGGRGNLILWDVDTGKKKGPFPAAGAASNRVAFGVNPKGEHLLAYGVPRGLTVRNLKTKEPPLTLKSSLGNTHALAFSPDGKFLARGSNYLEIFDLATRKDILARPQPRGQTTSVAVSPNGEWIASNNKDGLTRLWDVRKRKQVKRLPSGVGMGADVTFTSNGSKVVVNGGSGAISVWDVRKGVNLQRFSTGAGSWSNMALHPDNKRIAVSSEYGTATIWDLETKKLLHKLNQPAVGLRHDVAFSPDGKVLASGGGTKDRKGLLKLWDADTGKEIRSKSMSREVVRLAFRPDGQELAVVMRGEAIHLLDPNNKRALRILPNSGGHRWWRFHSSITYSPDGKLLAASGGSNVHVWDVQTGQRLYHWQFDGVVEEVTFAPDSRHLITANGNSTIYVLRLDKHKSKSK